LKRSLKAYFLYGFILFTYYDFGCSCSCSYSWRSSWSCSCSYLCYLLLAAFPHCAPRTLFIVPGALGALESARADNNSYMSQSCAEFLATRWSFRQFPYHATRPGTSCGQTFQLNRDNKSGRRRKRGGDRSAGLVIKNRCHCSSVVACSFFFILFVLFSPSFVFCVFCLSVMHVRFLLAGKVLELL